MEATGSSRAARRAGRYAASSPTPRSTALVATNASGSSASTPRRRPWSTRVSAAIPSAAIPSVNIVNESSTTDSVTISSMVVMSATGRSGSSSHTAARTVGASARGEVASTTYDAPRMSPSLPSGASIG
jgi:hypothetical protein